MVYVFDETDWVNEHVRPNLYNESRFNRRLCCFVTTGEIHAFRSHQKRGDQKHSNDGHPRRRPKPPRRRPSSSENPTDHQFHFTSERAAAFAPPAHHTGELGQPPCVAVAVAHETVFYSTSRASAALRRVHTTLPSVACHTTLDFTPLHERACRRLRVACRRHWRASAAALLREQTTLFYSI